MSWISQSAKRAVGGGRWRLDGYDTCESKVEEADPQAPLDEEMDVDLEEEGPRSDIELSLSDSD